MGKINDCLNHYLRNKRRFADLYNGVFFRGEQLIDPNELTDSSENYEEAEGEKPKTVDRGKRLSQLCVYITAKIYGMAPEHYWI